MLPFKGYFVRYSSPIFDGRVSRKSYRNKMKVEQFCRKILPVNLLFLPGSISGIKQKTRIHFSEGLGKLHVIACSIPVARCVVFNTEYILPLN